MPGSSADPVRGFLLNLSQCTGCHACELACSTENELGWGQSWRQVVPFNGERIPAVESYHLSLACNHCADAPCMTHCPALAIDRNEATGAVLIDGEKCIGCKYCSWACPYDAPRFDSQAQVMTKCTWCDHRLAEGGQPACVEQCPTTALGFGELEGAKVVPGFPDTPARPSIRFAYSRAGSSGPESTWELPAEVLRSFEAARPSPSGISLRGEWPLWVFSLIVSALVGWTLAAQVSQIAPSPWVFVAALGVAAAVSTLHLGQKQRMWRAVLNVRRSWLSREIASFGTFGVAACAWLLWPEVRGLGGLAATLGVAALFCIDRVYDLVRNGTRIHSADALLTGVLVAGLSLGGWEVASGLLLVKLTLYLGRWRSESGALMARATRVTSLIGLLVLLAVGSSPGSVWVWLLVALGEGIDRAQFYQGLVIRSPRRQAAEDLAPRLVKA